MTAYRVSNLDSKLPNIYAEVEYFADFEGLRRLRMPDGQQFRTVNLIDADINKLCKEYIEDIICNL